jgi:hypothetical protein
MHRTRDLRLSIPTAISLLALFFALGGSAFAIGNSSSSAAAVKPQPRCQRGTVRGIAAVTGEPSKGIANIGEEFTSNPAAFAQKYNCTGGGVVARRVDRGVYDVRFNGNKADSAVVSGYSGEAIGTSVARLPDGTFRVRVAATVDYIPTDMPFVIIAV